MFYYSFILLSLYAISHKTHRISLLINNNTNVKIIKYEGTRHFIKSKKLFYYSTWLSSLQNLPNQRNYSPTLIWEYLDNFNCNRIYNMARKLFDQNVLQKKAQQMFLEFIRLLKAHQQRNKSVISRIRHCDGSTEGTIHILLCINLHERTLLFQIQPYL